MAVQELPQEQQQLAEELARFRNRLEPLERRILDSVVRQACEPGEPQVAQPEADQAPSEEDVAQLVEKIDAFEQTLPADQRRLLDSILAQGSHKDSEVEPHTLLWAYWGGAGPAFWAVFAIQCANDGGTSLQYQPDWWHYWGTFGEYRCWKW
jgi:hypothetical protein